MTRRQLLPAALALPSAVSFGAQPSAPPVQLKSIETFRVPVNRRGDWVLVRITASNGIRGIGDASHGARDDDTISHLTRLWDIARKLPVAGVEQLRQHALPQVAAHGRSAAVAFSAIEQCMWDILAQMANRPLYELLGGALRREIRCYANINRRTEDRSPEGFARSAQEAVAAGFDAIKLAPFDDIPPRIEDSARLRELVRPGLDRTAAVRAAIGPKIDLLIDVHSRVNLTVGLEIVKELEAQRLFWIEEVTPRLEDLAVITARAAMPHAGGESVFGLRGFWPYLQAKAFHILMPDVKYCGGIFELKKIAALAEAAGAPVSPHGPASPVGNLAAAHVCAGMPNFHILEHAFGEAPWREELVDPPEEIRAGMLQLTGRPGLGVTLNDRLLAKLARV